MKPPRESPGATCNDSRIRIKRIRLFLFFEGVDLEDDAKMKYPQKDCIYIKNLICLSYYDDVTPRRENPRADARKL